MALPTATETKDMTGQRIGMLTVVRQGPSYKSPSGSSARAQWWCQCDCGSPEVLIRGDQLRRRESRSSSGMLYKEVRSCGCLATIAQSKPEEDRIYKHGLTHAEFKSMVIAQYGRCKACGKNEGMNLTVHHDHGHCDKNQGCKECIICLLCDGCNSASGRVRDDPVILRKLAEINER